MKYFNNLPTNATWEKAYKIKRNQSNLLGYQLEINISNTQDYVTSTLLMIKKNKNFHEWNNLLK